MLRSVRNRTPWWAIITAKVVLARVPVPYSFWKRIGIFQHGDMDQPERALAGFLLHAETAGVLDEDRREFLREPGRPFVVLEIGPGDSLFDAQIARALGASQTWMVDAGPFATTSMAAYAAMSEALAQAGLPAEELSAEGSLRDLLTLNATRYLTEGVRSLRQIPDRSVDYSFSNAVVEHIDSAEFDEFAQQLFRTHKPGSVSVHRVDLKDHLGSSLHNLRFSDSMWDSELFRSSGFYTNRLRFTSILRRLQAVGFDTEVTRVVTWDQLPLPRSALAAPFNQMTEDELLVSGFDVRLTVPH